MAEDIKLTYRVYLKSRPFQIHISYNLYCFNLTARNNKRVKTQGRLHMGQRNMFILGLIFFRHARPIKWVS